MAEITGDEALELLQGGEDDVAEWNRRREAGDQIPKLSGVDLSEANLYVANLSGAILSEAQLFWANLSGADLTDANLSRARLGGANLSGANLSEANLYRANLSGADLRGAKNLTQEQLDSSFIYEGETVILPDGFNQPPSRPRPDDE